ncbi:MAG: HAD-IB family hydrolase [Desulfotalea sp.]|nr:MAG: HAD-IB family hydrolase [Desulfotalea sp.]
MKRAAFFDLDLTITNLDSFRLFLRHFYRRRRRIYIPYILLFLVLRKLRIISLHTFKEHALIGLRGKTKNEIKLIGVEFFQNHLQKTIREHALLRIRKHQRNNESIYIVSASPDIYLQAISQHLNCDGYICSKLHYKRFKFSGTLSGKDCIGAEKKQRVEQLANTLLIDLKNSSAYSDHEADLPFLETVGNIFAISPSRRLHTIARRKNWIIEHW